MTDAPDDKTLEELEETIEAARRQAEADGLIDGPDAPHHTTFADPDGDGTSDGAAGAP